MLKRFIGDQIKVQVNRAFVRDGQPHRLCGSSANLEALLIVQGKTLGQLLLMETLRMMMKKSVKTDMKPALCHLV